MSKLTKALTAAAGNAGGESLYVEDVFSTNLYVGNGSALTVETGLDQNTEGGMVWVKSRSDVTNHGIWDTERTNGYYLPVNSTDNGGNISAASGSVPFLRDGSFRWNSGHGWFNNSSSTYAAWAFRKAEKFFDVVTWTGDGNAATQISHSLNSTPGAIIVKKTSATGNWSVYHSYLGTGNYLRLDRYFGDTTDADYFPEVTDSYFRPGSDNHVNESGQSFVAYLFASDAGGFGDDGDENIIKCGSYTGTGSFVDVNVGFEPQFVIVKSADFGNGDTDWFIIDTMRGFTFEPNTNYEFKALRANENFAEAAQGRCGLTSTGFVAGGIDATGASGRNYIYIAIRRPMKTPESGTEVYMADKDRQTSSSSVPNYYSGFPVDLGLIKYYTAATDWALNTRLLGETALIPNSTAAETTSSDSKFDYMDGFGEAGNASTDFIGWSFKRATGFMDVVAYTGDGVAGRTLAHNLGVAPELMIVKRRNNTANWPVYHASVGATQYANLNQTNSFTASSGYWNNTAPTDAVFTVGSFGNVNSSGQFLVAYLFATLDGVSKVGSYTGNGTGQNIDCGFSNGARFVLLKDADDDANWNIYDTERGISTGTSYRLNLNDTGANSGTTNSIEPYSGGFRVKTEPGSNASGHTFIYLAIA